MPTELAVAVPAMQPWPQRPRPARIHQWLWYSALLITVVTTLGGLGILYEDDTYWQRSSNDRASQNAILTSHNAVLSQQLQTAQTGLSESQSLVSTLTAKLQHPELGLWNVQQRISGANWYLAGGIPDTFTYHLQATSSGPMSVSIVTFEQFAAAIACVDGGVGNTNWCMHHSSKGTVMSWLNVTSVTYDFHLAEGCANYMVVFTAANAVSVQPNVTVKYNPAPTFTGDCR